MGRGLTVCSENEPFHFGSKHVRQNEGQPGKGPVQLAQQLVLRRGPGKYSAAPVRCPRTQLTYHNLTCGDRDTAARRHSSVMASKSKASVLMRRRP